MVNANIIRIRNETSRRFVVTPAGFLTNGAIKVDNADLTEAAISIGPGKDLQITGLQIPWDILTQSGLIIEAYKESEEPTESLHVTVGVSEIDSYEQDWIKLHDVQFNPIATKEWLPLGKRHALGMVGVAVEVGIVFQNRFSASTDLSKLVKFDFAQNVAPPNSVFLNVYDLAAGFHGFNAMLCNSTVQLAGAFHVGIEVFGEEWSFYRTPNLSSCGICRSVRPKVHSSHAYRETISLGVTAFEPWEVRYLIVSELAPQWLGGTYHLLNRNCIHFCDFLTLKLGVQPVPSWIKNLHETGASLYSTFYAGGAEDEEDAEAAKRLADGACIDAEGTPADELSTGRPRNAASASSCAEDKGDDGALAKASSISAAGVSSGQQVALGAFAVRAAASD